MAKSNNKTRENGMPSVFILGPRCSAEAGPWSVAFDSVALPQGRYSAHGKSSVGAGGAADAVASR